MFLIGNGLKEGYFQSPFIFNFDLIYTIRRVQVYQDVSKLNGTLHLLVYAVDVNILGGSVHSTMEKT